MVAATNSCILFSAFSLTTMERPVHKDPLAELEARIVHSGLRILGIISFLAFMAWALAHLAKMFV